VKIARVAAAAAAVAAAVVDTVAAAAAVADIVAAAAAVVAADATKPTSINYPRREFRSNEIRAVFGFLQ
jgi:hypothetical protein